MILNNMSFYQAIIEAPERQLTLNEIYNWFTEGFDTQDLKDVKALLAELEKPGKQRQSKRQPKRRK